MAAPALVKGVWFVTARRHLLEVHGDTALQAVGRAMKPDNGRALLEPLAVPVVPRGRLPGRPARRDGGARASRCGPVLPVHRGLHAARREHLLPGAPAHHDAGLPDAQDAGPLAPVSTQRLGLRRRGGRSTRALLSWRNVPYLADRNYRLYLVAMMAKCSELVHGQAADAHHHRPRRRLGQASGGVLRRRGPPDCRL